MPRANTAGPGRQPRFHRLGVAAGRRNDHDRQLHPALVGCNQAMEWTEVIARIHSGEDQHTELGRFRHWNEKDWLEAVCAFANTEGGLIVLGVDAKGRIEGVPMDSEEVQERLTSGLHTALNTPVRARHA